MENLHNLKVPELKQKLKELNLPTTGLKAELAERLKNALEKQEEEKNAEENAEIDITETTTEEGEKEQQSSQPMTEQEKKKIRAERFGITVNESETEKRKKRSERFGVPMVESEAQKRQRRAERFGTASSSTAPKGTLGTALKAMGQLPPTQRQSLPAKASPSNGLSVEELEKRQQRAQRFGIQQ